MKEILEAIESRIKSPVLGYFVTAFVALNWKAIFFLIVENKGALERIFYFDNNTDYISLFVLPAITASLITVCYPWVNCLFIYLCIKPTEIKNNFQARSEHQLLVQKQKLENIRTSIISSAERALIDRAKRDDELGEIKDENIKEKLKLEIEQLRAEKAKFNSGDTTNDFENPQRLLELAESYRNRAEKSKTTTDQNKLIEQANEIEMKALTAILGPKKP